MTNLIKLTKIYFMVGGLGSVSIIRLVAIVVALLFLQTGCAPKNSSGDSEIPGVGKFDFTIIDGRANFAVVFSALKIDAGARLVIPGMPQSYIELSPDFESGGMLFVTSVAIAELFKNNSGLPNLGLPDGRPIPGTREGFLPARVVQLPVFGTSVFYQGRDIFGIFVPIEFGPLPVNITTRMRDEMGNLLGVITAVAKGAKQQVSGALFLFPVEGSSSQKMLLASVKQ